MKRGLVWALSVIFLLAMAVPALAIPLELKLKLSVVHEDIDITKCIYLGIKQLKQVDKSAEANVSKFDWNFGNDVDEKAKIIEGNQILEEPDTVLPVIPEALIHDSVFNDFSGIISINQSPGNVNNQGNAVSTAFADCGDAFLHAQASVQKINGELLSIGNDMITSVGDVSVGSDMSILPITIGEGNQVEAEFTPRSDLITNCLIGVHGVVGINQSAGNVNNQNNAVAMAVSDKAVACLAESDLLMISGGNEVEEKAVTKYDTLEGAIFSGSGSSGIVGINQATGNICNQANVISSCLLAPF
jgi:hypothetical protein